MSTQDNLTPDELKILLGALRAAIRRAERGRAALADKYGDEYDDSRPAARLELLETTYRKLGGDPSRITNRGDSPCEGHESLRGDLMGESFYCNGSCKVR